MPPLPVKKKPVNKCKTWYKIRNKILDWALLLEENGIVGNEMTFTDVEKQIAIDTPIINNYINNFYSKVSDVDMKQG